MKNKFQHIFRVAVCLVLVCCLTVNVSPIKAKATGAGVASTFAVAGVPAGLAVCAGVVGLGVMAGVTTDALDGVVDGCVGSTAMGQYILDGVIDAVKYTDPDGNVRWLFPLAFLDSLRSLLFGNSVVSDVSGDYSLEYTVDGTSASITSSYPFEVRHICGSYYVDGTLKFSQSIVVSTGLVARPFNSGTKYYYASDLSCNSLGYYYKAPKGSTGGTYPSSAWVVSGIDSVYLGVFNSLTDYHSAFGSLVFDVPVSSTSLDLTLGDVGVASQSFSTVHPTWASNAITVPGVVTGSDVDEKYVPVGIPGDYKSALNSTQEDVQSGVSVFTGIVFEEDTTTPTIEPTEPNDTVVGAEAVTATLLERLFGGVQEKLDLTYISIQEIPELLREFMADVKTGFEELPTKFSEWFDTIIENIKALPDAFEYFFDCLLEGIQLLPEAMGKVLSDLFVPSQDFVQTKVETMLANFPFIGNIISTGTYIRDSLFASSPPVIYVDLSAADGDIDYGEKTLLTDFSWYAPYKGTVDSVLGAALWAFFGWRVFLRLPGLISGAEGYVGEFRTRYDAYSKKRKED